MKKLKMILFSMLFSSLISINNTINFFASEEDLLSLNFCEDPNILKSFKMLGTILFIIKILIPVTLIIMGMVSFAKVVLNDGEIKDSVKLFIQKFFIAALIFFIPTIIGAIMNYVDGYDKTKTKFTSCGKCLTLPIKGDCITLIANATTKANALAKARQDKKEQEKQANLAKYNNDQSKKDKKNNVISNTQSQVISNTSGIKTVMGMPYYAQCSANFKTIQVGTRKYNTCGCGCSFSSLAMVIDGLTKSNNTTIGIVNYFNPKTYASNFCVMRDTTLYDSQIKSHFGVTPNILFSRKHNIGSNSSEAESRKQKIVSSLESGHAIVLLVPGHYIALAGIKDGKISVLDPGNSGSNGSYTVDALWKKYYNHKNRCNDDGKCGFVYAVEYSV